MKRAHAIKKKVMIVDDDECFLEELGQLLHANGYAVIPLPGPRQVVETAEAAKPDVILLDLKMKGGDGFQIADELRQFTSTVHIPVIAMTGFYTEHEHTCLMNICGIRRCITKPFAPAEIIRAIETKQ